MPNLEVVLTFVAERAMNYLTVCSGIESPSVAWKRLGWFPVAFSEIDDFPAAVLTERWPGVPNLGDMTKNHDWPDRIPVQVDLVAGGTPCQSFSVAGLRRGLEDPRGNLTLVFLAVLARLRPRWVVWENVTGVLSIDKGRAFGSLLGGLGKLGYGFAYRVLDAQYVRVESHPRAVPQRRRRVFVVGCLGGWQRAAAVLFERESLSWHYPPSRKTGSVTPPITAVGVDGSRRGSDFETGGGLVASVAPCLDSSYGRKHGVTHQDMNNDHGLLVVTKGRAFGGNNTSGEIEVASACNAHGGPHGRLDFESETFVVEGKDDHIAFDARQSDTVVYGDKSGPLDTFGNSIGVCSRKLGVRRLTPRECERLQGFPDDYTLIPWRGRGRGVCPDGHRYKAIGNSIAVNCMAWLGRRINLVNEGIK